MFSLTALVKRNIKTYLRDKTAVFFSFLSVIILLSLYLLFLGNNFRPEVGGALTENEITFLVYSQLIPGLIVINTLSIPLGNLGTVINDFEYRQIDGFLVTPIKRYKVILGYYISTFIITVIISTILIVGSFIVIGLVTGIYFGFIVYIQTILLTILFAFISTAIMIFVTSLIKSVNAFGAVSGIFGTVVGFVSGIYMPLFILPDFMAKVASLVPFTHMNILLKKIIMPTALDLFDPNMPGYTETMEQLKIAYGYNEIGVVGLNIQMPFIMIGCILLSIGLLVLSTRLMNQRIKK